MRTRLINSISHEDIYFISQHTIDSNIIYYIINIPEDKELIFMNSIVTE